MEMLGRIRRMSLVRGFGWRTAAVRKGARLYPGRVEIASDELIVARHERLSNRGHICYDWQHYVALVQRKPGAQKRRALCRHAAALAASAPGPDAPGPDAPGWRRQDHGAGSQLRVQPWPGCGVGGGRVGDRVWGAEHRACPERVGPVERACGASPSALPHRGN